MISKVGEKLAIFIPGAIILLLGSFLITNLGQSPSRKPVPEILPEKPSRLENDQQAAVFVYHREREIPPDPFLKEVEEIKSSLPRPDNLKARGIIRGREVYLAIIETEGEVYLVRKGDGFMDWEIEGIFSDHIVLSRIPGGTFYYLSVGGD